MMRDRLDRFIENAVKKEYEDDKEKYPVLSEEEFRHLGYRVDLKLPQASFKTNPKRKLRRPVFAAVLITLLMFATAMAGIAVRVIIYNQSKVESGRVTMTSGGIPAKTIELDANEAYSLIKQELGCISIPSKLPTAIQLTDVTVSPGYAVLQYAQEGGKFMEFRQTLLEVDTQSAIVVDTENGKTYTKEINGHTVTAIEAHKTGDSEKWYSLSWSDECLYYNLDGNIELEDMYKFIKSLELTKESNNGGE